MIQIDTILEDDEEISCEATALKSGTEGVPTEHAGFNIYDQGNIVDMQSERDSNEEEARYDNTITLDVLHEPEEALPQYVDMQQAV